MDNTQNKLTIRPATEADIPRLMEIFELAKGIMRGNGNMKQWTGNYPSLEILQADMDSGHSFVCLDAKGTIVGTFAFIVGADPTYAKIYNGEWLDDTLPYGVIHRIASIPGQHGVASACLDYCGKHIENLRIDTHRDNTIMQHIMEKHRFTYCGIIYLANGDERLAYQRLNTDRMTREETVLDYLRRHNIPFTVYNHPEGKTIEEAKRWWKDDGSVHCKNIFLRNHKGNQHYLVSFHCDYDLSIHELEQRLKARLQAAGKPSCGKLSFASAERMMKYLGLEPGSVSPFGLINDTEHHVLFFIDETLRNADTLSFHPNDCRGTVVIKRTDFERYLHEVGNAYEWMELY